MRFSRSDLDDALASLRAALTPEVRALGDNIAFEENVGPDRLADFVSFTPAPRPLPRALAEYFNASVQGAELGHVPSTFGPANAPALLRNVAAQQKIVRIERIDQLLEVLRKGGDRDQAFELIATAVRGRGDVDVIGPFTRALNAYPGARPSFAAFRAEVSGELAADPQHTAWAAPLISRLGLGHHRLAKGEFGYFALMEYTVAEVLSARADMDVHFAIPTVLDGGANAYFFPAPAGCDNGYAVDLQPHAGREPLREILHARIPYRPTHLARVAKLEGPFGDVDIPLARDKHLARVRGLSGRDDYGVLMAGEDA